MKPLRIPVALSFVVAGGAALVSLASSCDDANPPVDAATGCNAYCIEDTTTDAGCPPDLFCAGDAGECPSGCRPVG